MYPIIDILIFVALMLYVSSVVALIVVNRKGKKDFKDLCDLLGVSSSVLFNTKVSSISIPALNLTTRRMEYLNTKIMAMVDYLKLEFYDTSDESKLICRAKKKKVKS